MLEEVKMSNELYGYLSVAFIVIPAIILTIYFSYDSKRKEKKS